MCIRKDTTVSKAEFRSNKRRFRRALQEVDIDTLTLQGNTVPGFHLRYHLDSMAAQEQTAHRYAEASVGCSASGHGCRIILRTVKVYGNYLGS